MWEDLRRKTNTHLQNRVNVLCQIKEKLKKINQCAMAWEAERGEGTDITITEAGNR